MSLADGYLCYIRAAISFPSRDNRTYSPGEYPDGVRQRAHGKNRVFFPRSSGLPDPHLIERRGCFGDQFRRIPDLPCPWAPPPPARAGRLRWPFLPERFTSTSAIKFPVRVLTVCNQIRPGRDLNEHMQCNQDIHRRSQGVQ
jgi:hypothetical protein